MLRALSSSAVLLAAAVLLSGCAGLRPSPPESAPPPVACSNGSDAGARTAPLAGGAIGIMSRGTCKVVGVPDTATVVVELENLAPTGRAALDANNSRTDAVVAALRAKRVEGKDVRLGELRVGPVLSPVLNSANGVGGDRITGFRASKLVTATLHDVGASEAVTASVVDAAGDAGRVQLTYSITEDAALRAQARAAAVRLAQDKAKQMAEAAGLALGQLLSITDTPAAPAVAPSKSSEAIAPVVPDGQELEVSVDVSYAIS